MKNIVFTGGGTAGHIMPNLAIINQIKGYKIYYLGSNGMEKEIISKYKNITFIEVPSVKLIRSLNFKNLLLPIKLIKSINVAKKKLKEIHPSLIFSKGGFVSVPVCLAGHSLKIPVLTHESDLSIGLANKVIAKKSKALLCSFKETANAYGKNAIYTGSPIRNEIFNGNKNIVIERHNIKTSKPIILIVGGSLGAKYINNIIEHNIDKLTKNYFLIHIIGKNNKSSTQQNKDYIQLDFVKDIENYLALCDMVISRAGSNSIFELASLKKPSLLIPLPKGNSRGDQIENANLFKKKNLANVIYQENLTFESLLKKIQETLKNKDFYIKNLSREKNLDGTEKIINLIHKYTK